MVDQLWAAWRSRYVRSADDARVPVDAACVMCALAAGDDEHHVVHRGPGALCVMNRFPYTSGHVMIIPARHVADLSDLDDAESAELWAMVEDAVAAVRDGMGAAGVNVGANLGAAAGAGLPGHLHVHVVPRWRGDTNFMTSVADVRVIPEDLEASTDRLRAAWPAPDLRRGWPGR